LAIQLSANEFKSFGRRMDKKWLVSVNGPFENKLTWMEVRKADDKMMTIIIIILIIITIIIRTQVSAQLLE
jgi:hypothetical protein